MHSAIHACKQTEHDFKFSRAKEAFATAILDMEIKKEKYAQVHNSEKKRQKGIQEKIYLLPPNPLWLQSRPTTKPNRL